LAELRSFIIGVAVAAALLGFGAFMLGAFDGPSEGAPSLVVAGTPGVGSSVDFPAPTSAAAASPAPASGTPSPTPRPSATDSDRTTCNEIVGTPFRSDRERDFFLANCTHLLVVPTPVPAGPGGGPGYKGNASRLVADLGLQISYLADRATQPAVEDANWRQFSNQAIQNVQSIAGQIEALTPAVPPCGAQAHQAVVPAAQQSRTAVDQMNQAIIASSNDAVARTINALAAARGQVSQAAGAVERALC
jgi:hypothetical protein